RPAGEGDPRRPAREEADRLPRQAARARAAGERLVPAAGRQARARGAHHAGLRRLRHALGLLQRRRAARARRGARPVSVRLPLAALCLLFALLSSSCGKHAHGMKELEEATHYYYNDLRWNRLPAAAARMHPDIRTAFLEDWTKRGQERQLQDLEIVSIQADLAQDNAEVTMRSTMVERPA